MLSHLVIAYILIFAVIWAHMTAGFVYSLLIHRNDIADVLWGIGFILISAITFFYFPISTNSLVVMTLVSLWGLRLALHIHRRNKKKTEDPRYAQWRKDWGKWFVLRSYFQVYMLQGLLMILVATPIIFINVLGEGVSFGWLGIAGVLVWIFGFLFEAIGDHELALFMKRKKNKNLVLQTGLWKYTRHPNYFGEVTLWWGIWLIALAVPYGVYSIIGPLTITGLILFVSGIPMLEARLSQNPDYRIYRDKTSKFFPLPPKK